MLGSSRKVHQTLQRRPPPVPLVLHADPVDVVLAVDDELGRQAQRVQQRLPVLEHLGLARARDRAPVVDGLLEAEQYLGEADLAALGQLLVAALVLLDVGAAHLGEAVAHLVVLLDELLPPGYLRLALETRTAVIRKT